jgi:ATP-dependent DNA helicase RecG
MDVPGGGIELGSPVSSLKGVGPKLAKLLEKKGLETVEDVLFFVPRDYEDRRRITPIRELVEGASAVVFGKVVDARSVGAPRFGSRFGSRRGGAGFQVTLDDGTGRLQLYWFKAFPSLSADFAVGAEVLCYGIVSRYGLFLRMAHPEYEATERDASGKVVPSPQFGRIVPVYSETEGLGQKVLRRIAATALRSSLSVLDDPLPTSLRDRHALPPLRDSVLRVHYPPELPPPSPPAPEELVDDGPPPRPPTPELRRLVFEECFLLQLALRLRRDERRADKGLPLPLAPEAARRFVDALPFPFTGDQRRAVDAIAADLAGTSPMVRLLQGDVGAGKTVVALAAAVQAAAGGTQTVILAPTEVLAQQHHRTAETLLSALRLPVALLTASTSGDRKLEVAIAAGDVAVVVGTHAVFQDPVRYRKLGLVVVDEQHRFGVAQRAALLRKASGYVPHLLMMTATPIPRTLALTQFGDLDVSVLREKPAGRKPVMTRIVPDSARDKLYATVRETIARGEQVYVIYPLVEESEKLDLRSATAMYEELSRSVFPDVAMELVHGKLPSEEKDRRLAAFRDGAVRLLVSTTVVEVGIDVPNATLMVIEHPERLGLSQLHQLRGRVGRGAKESRCLLVAQGKATRRLRVLERTDDGFEIAEEDLKIRGPGEFLGLRQSGLLGFRLADAVRDADLMVAAREEADAILDRDPELRLPEHQAIAKALGTRWRSRLDRMKNG